MLIHKKYIAHTLCILLFFTNEIKSQSHEGHDHSQPSKKEDTVKPTKELKKSNSKSVEVETVKPEIVPNEERTESRKLKAEILKGRLRDL